MGMALAIPSKFFKGGEMLGKNGSRIIMENCSLFINSSGYISVWKDGKWYNLHKLVYEMLYGKTTKTIHHVDGDKLNNNSNNLIKVSKAKHKELHSIK